LWVKAPKEKGDTQGEKSKGPISGHTGTRARAVKFLMSTRGKQTHGCGQPQRGEWSKKRRTGLAVLKCASLQGGPEGTGGRYDARACPLRKKRGELMPETEKDRSKKERGLVRGLSFALIKSPW